MSHDVRSDAEFLCHLCDSCPCVADRATGVHITITAKLIAHWTGLSLQTVSDYKTGKTNIPVGFWRALLEHTFDLRILALICPWDAAVEIRDIRINQAPSGPQFFRQAVELEGKHHEQMKYVAEMLADGRIDELDLATVKGYDDAYQEHRQRDAALHHAIVNTFSRTMERKAAARD